MIKLKFLYKPFGMLVIVLATTIGCTPCDRYNSINDPPDTAIVVSGVKVDTIVAPYLERVIDDWNSFTNPTTIFIHGYSSKSRTWRTDRIISRSYPIGSTIVDLRSH